MTSQLCPEASQLVPDGPGLYDAAMIISQIAQSDLEAVSVLVRRVFDAHVAGLYPPEGCGEFYRFIEPASLSAGLGSGLSGFVAREAEDGGAPVGVLVLRDPAHLSLFFVESKLQRTGVGRQLFDRAATVFAGQGAMEFTVNASPNSVAVYVALGFAPTGPLQEKNGITFVPMVRTLADYTGRAEVPPEPLLPGPAALLICGFEAAQRRDLGLFLGLLLGREPRLCPVTADSFDRTVGDLLRAPETEDPARKVDGLPHVVLFSGCAMSEARRVLAQWKASELPRPIFSVATESNLDFTVRELLEHLVAEHSAHGGRP